MDYTGRIIGSLGLFLIHSVYIFYYYFRDKVVEPLDLYSYPFLIFFGGNLQRLNELYPNTDVQWMQNNQGSAFYLKNGEDLQRISPIGAVDTSLLDGENRMVDFRFNNDLNLTSGSNGIYHQNQNPSLDNGLSNLTRTSDAYIQGTNGDKFQDSRFNAALINPDSYYKAGLTGGADMRSSSDRMADRLNTVYGNISSKISGQPGYVEPLDFEE